MLLGDVKNETGDVGEVGFGEARDEAGNLEHVEHFLLMDSIDPIDPIDPIHMLSKTFFHAQNTFNRCTARRTSGLSATG